MAGEHLLILSSLSPIWTRKNPNNCPALSNRTSFKYIGSSKTLSAMVRFKINIPFSWIATVAVMSLGVIITSLVNLKFVGLGNGNEFKLQLSVGAASFYALLILSCGVATYFLVRRK